MILRDLSGVGRLRRVPKDVLVMVIRYGNQVWADDNEDRVREGLTTSGAQPVVF